jgi:hypothetical protein
MNKQRPLWDKRCYPGRRRVWVIPITRPSVSGQLRNHRNRGPVRHSHPNPPSSHPNYSNGLLLHGPRRSAVTIEEDRLGASQAVYSQQRFQVQIATTDPVETLLNDNCVQVSFDAFVLKLGPRWHTPGVAR